MHLVNPDTSLFRVFDNFLPEEQFKELSSYLATSQFGEGMEHSTPFYGEVIEEYYGLNQPRMGPTTISQAEPLLRVFEHFPTRTPLDLLTKGVYDNADVLSQWIGKRHTDWDCFALMSYLNDSKSGLKWHLDSDHRKAVIVYYANKQWEPHWGGELCILPPHKGERLTLASFESGEAFQSTLVNELNNGLMIHIPPRPNRLVVMPTGIFHKVLPVNAQAHGVQRFSVTGFFIKNEDFLDAIAEKETEFYRMNQGLEATHAY